MCKQRRIHNVAACGVLDRRIRCYVDSRRFNKEWGNRRFKGTRFCSLFGQGGVVSSHRTNVAPTVSTEPSITSDNAPRTDFAVATRNLPRFKLSQRDLIFFIDMWIVLACLWATRLFTGTLDPGVGVFGLTTFVVLVVPKSARDRLGPNVLDDVGPIFRRICIAYAAGSATIAIADKGWTRVLLLVSASTALTLMGGRAVAYKIERVLRRQRNGSRVLVVGGGVIARRVISTLGQHPEYGLEVVGAADDDPQLPSGELGAPILGGLHEVPRLVRAHGIHIVIVAFCSSNQGNMVDVIRSAMMNGAQGWVVPRLFELGSRPYSGDHLWGLPMMRLQTPARSRPEWALKRAFDFVLAGIGVFLLWPVMALIAAAVLVESGRPLLFKQRRLGLNGREFNIVKFRTMKVVDESVSGMEWAADDNRVTRVGRVLRATNLDELPQLFNILAGQMSIVGPRPERPHFVQLFSGMYPNYGSRHRFPAGMTGWAQVHGLIGDTSIEDRIAFDNYYIENWSLAQDMKILAKSVVVQLRKWGR
jgi:exopolysaccharide biosynthesis polyprenyl glycosylphosphotransferase